MLGDQQPLMAVRGAMSCQHVVVMAKTSVSTKCEI